MKNYYETRLNELSCFEKGWFDKNEEYGEVPSLEIIQKVRNICVNLNDRINVSIFPLPEGGILMEGKLNDWYWSLDMFNNKDVFEYASYNEKTQAQKDESIDMNMDTKKIAEYLLKNVGV